MSLPIPLAFTHKLDKAFYTYTGPHAAVVAHLLGLLSEYSPVRGYNADSQQVWTDDVGDNSTTIYKLRMGGYTCCLTFFQRSGTSSLVGDAAILKPILWPE
jgi:hypothetical protein